MSGDVRQLLQQAEAKFAAAQKALQSGDLEGYAKAQAEARDLVQEALAAAGKATPSGSPSPSASASPSNADRPLRPERPVGLSTGLGFETGALVVETRPGNCRRRRSSVGARFESATVVA